MVLTELQRMCRCYILFGPQRGRCQWPADQEDGLCDGCRSSHGTVNHSPDFIVLTPEQASVIKPTIAAPAEVPF